MSRSRRCPGSASHSVRSPRGERPLGPVETSSDSLDAPSHQSRNQEGERMSEQVDPSHIMEVGMGFWASKTLLSAVELELFTKLGEEPMTEIGRASCRERVEVSGV